LHRNWSWRLLSLYELKRPPLQTNLDLETATISLLLSPPQQMALPFHLQPTTLFLTKFPKPLSPLCYFTATMSNQADPTKPTSQNTLQTPQNYPVPLSPPLPAISKNIELTRATSASSKSSLFTLSPTHVLYHDEWLIAVNKPQGVYCETVLASVPQLLCDSADSEGLLGLFSIFCFVGRFWLGRPVDSAIWVDPCWPRFCLLAKKCG
jgi:hypothetical protein